MTDAAALARAAAVERRLRGLRARLSTDAVLAAEVADFLPGEWQEEAEGVVCRVGERWCRVSAAEVTLGHDRWPGSKRIPL